jgi:hypothetical protein
MTTHLEQANETYFEHMKSSLGFSLKALKASFYFALHSLFPGIFTSSGSTEIFELATILEKKIKNTSLNKKNNNRVY